MDSEKLTILQEKAKEARILLLQMLTEAKSGHTAGPLGMADVFTSLYFHILSHNPQNPEWIDRDRLVLSNGHICPIQYVSLAQAGYFPIDELKTLRKIDSRLQGHPHRTTLPGLETTSGPLGEGLSQGIGFALSAKLDQKSFRTYVISGDGEMDEGNVWEALMFAGKIRINNLTLIIDRNDIQIDGFTHDVMPLEPLKEKLMSFNWHVLETDGNNIVEFIHAIDQANDTKNKPTAVIAKTVPGKGVSFMENDYKWHGVPPDTKEMEGAPPVGEQLTKALEELNAKS